MRRGPGYLIKEFVIHSMQAEVRLKNKHNSQTRQTSKSEHQLKRKYSWLMKQKITRECNSIVCKSKRKRAQQQHKNRHPQRMMVVAPKIFIAHAARH
jgi:hypothetical protein